ncbi:hypothetical protein L3556_12675 [Candidatus Synechococcus calcipolaris G9]|uniref:DUF2203 domain-containing protein n=1 Tax=Candidatus Synechococcus calcipolaris G9 TaxID=1497997 RepID=A0ABT6F1S5_9SYNE|nr:hypothetical protein [Candidatus Synechococcus calcipolaris]MDG2991777.1 hypothetical protein [Candidatus Synechococcus calcipolaris G9]
MLIFQDIEFNKFPFIETPSAMTNSPSSPAGPDTPDEVEQAFQETQTRISELRQHYQRIRQAQDHLGQAQERSLATEVERLRQQIQELELDLGLTLLFSLGDAARERWQTILEQESFWQFVRFAGLGFILGLVVKSCTG